MTAERHERRTRAVYVISVAAELSGAHPQTLRIYERRGLVAPTRTRGGARRYSDADLERLRRIQALTAEGINLAGVARILLLEAQVAALEARVAELGARAADLDERGTGSEQAGEPG